MYSVVTASLTDILINFHTDPTAYLLTFLLTLQAAYKIASLTSRPITHDVNNTNPEAPIFAPGYVKTNNKLSMRIMAINSCPIFWVRSSGGTVGSTQCSAS